MSTTDEPGARIEVIRRSLAAFACGIVGLIPVLGLFPALYAIVCGIAVRGRSRNQWNPALPYLIAGIVLGCFGLLVSTVLLVVGGVAFVMQMAQ